MAMCWISLLGRAKACLSPYKPSAAVRIVSPSRDRFELFWQHRVISKTQSLDEEVVHFVEDQAITFRIIRSSMPFNSADIRFKLTSIDEGTLVTVSSLYALKYGLIGALMDRYLMQRIYSKGIRGLLDRLKTHVEAQVISVSR